MAKFGAEDAKKIEQEIVQAVEVSGADAVAAAIGKPVKFVQGLLEKGLSTKAGQQLVKGVQDLDKKLLDLRGKPQVTGEVTGEVPPPAFPATPRRGALLPLPENVEAEDIPAPSGSLARVQQRVQEAQPIEPIKQLQPPGRREETLRESLQESQPGMEQLPEYNLGIGPSKQTMARATLGVAGAGAAAAGYKLFGDKPLAQQPDAPSTIKAADINTPKDAVNLANNAIQSNAIPEEAKEQQTKNAEKIESIADILERKLGERQKAYDAAVARKELLQALETMMHGLITAVGAKAALDRGSPFAIDFSKGPQVNWEAQYNRLQKDFETQTNALIKKYSMEQELQLKQQQAAESTRRYEERMALEREKLGASQAKEAQQVAKQQAEETAKLNAAEQKQYQTNVKNFALLKEAIQNKKAGDVVQYATLLGADDQTIDELNKGKFERVLSWVKGEKSVDDILQGLRPQKPAPAAPAVDNMVTVTVNGQTGRIPRDQLEAFKQQYPNAEVQ